MSKEIYGYVRKLDVDGQIKIRQKDDYSSPVVFEGLFDQKNLLILKEAFMEITPITAEIVGDTLVNAKLEKPEPDLSYEFC